MNCFYDVRCEKCLVVDGKCWIIPVQFNALCIMDIDTGAVRIVEWGLGGEPGLASMRYMLAGAFKHKLILMPEYGSKVLVYDTVCLKFEEYPISIPELGMDVENGKDIKFRSAVVTDDAVWLTPLSAKHIIKYDPVRQAITDYTDWANAVQGYSFMGSPQFGNGVVVGDSLWMTCFQTNALLEFDMVKGTARLHHVGEAHNRFAVMTYCDENFWLLDNINQELVVWLPDKGSIWRNDNFPDNYGVDPVYGTKNDYNIASLYEADAGFIGIPCWGNSFIYIDRKTGLISKLAAKNPGSSYLYATQLHTGKIITPSKTDNKFLLYDFINGNITYVEPKFNPEELFPYTNMFYECKEMDLLSMLKNIDYYKSVLNVKSNKNASLLSGKRIYQYMGENKGVY